MVINIQFCSSHRRKGQILRAIEIINGIQNYFIFKIRDYQEIDICDDEEINWDLFCLNHRMNEEEYVIYITEKPFDDNWFSHEESRFSIITTNDWEESFAPPSLKAYLIYQIAQAAICFEGDLNENIEMKMVHESTEGCMFDLCIEKKDIRLGMIAGNICPICKSKLVRYGMNDKAIDSAERMIGYVRNEAIGNPVCLDEKSAFVVMRFSSNDENDNAYKYGIRSALEALNIECLRADSRILSGQFLDKIRGDIEKSRFIIVKVDSNNLNVFFELGLAMGLGKDVLLISDKDLVVQLPSDLRNWECLTYSKGDYSELKEKIIDYYREIYHYV